MAWMPIVMAVGAILGGVSAYSQGRTARRQGEAMQVAKQFEADQMDQNAGQVQAASQRNAMEQRRRASMVASRALAVSAAGGAGASDPTIEKIISDIDGEGEYRAGLAIYEGEERARRMRMGADAAEFEGGVAASGGRAAGRAGTISAVGSLASAAGGLYSKYGMGGPNPQAGALDQYQLFSGSGMSDPRYG